MFYPDGLPPEEEPTTSRGEPKAINHSATRFEKSTVTAADLLGKDPVLERLRTQHIWNDMVASTPALFRRDGGNAETGPDTPIMNGYGFVPAAPSPAPHRDIDPSELMTWGDIEGTPLLLDSGGDKTGPSFRLPPTPRRDEIGKRLSEQASRNIAKRAEMNNSRPKTMNSSWDSVTPRGSIRGSTSVHGAMSATDGLQPRTRLLSPAAQNLLNKSRAAHTSSIFGNKPSSSSGFGNTPSVRSTVSSPFVVPKKSTK